MNPARNILRRQRRGPAGFHGLLREAIAANAPCRLTQHARIPAPTLVELWTTAISRKEPSAGWLEWLFHSTLRLHTAPLAAHDRHSLTRFLALALGLLLRAKPAGPPADQEDRLRCWLAAIDVWEQALGPPLSPELAHRRLQIARLLGQPLPDDTRLLAPNTDPYIFATLLRSAARPQELVARLEGSQAELLRAISVACRSKGQLIHPAQPAGPPRPLSPSEALALLAAHPRPSLWKTGLILAQAECLVGQIRTPDHPPPGGQSIDPLLDTLRALLGLSLAESDKTLYGGRLEAHRLLRRQADGLEALLSHLLLSPPGLPVDFGLVCELIHGALLRRGPHILRPRTWKLLLSAHLKLAAQWSGPAGLARLLRLATRWAQLLVVPQTPPPQYPPVMFKKILPGDAGLLLLERVLFPEEELEAPADDEDRRAEQAFDRLVCRLQTMIRFLEAFGSPRRFKDRRLLRLIFLSVQKRASHAHHLCEESPQPLPGGSAGLEWSSRPDVWRDLQSRLAPAPPPSPSTRPQPLQPQLEQLHAHPPQEEPPRAQPHNQPRSPTRNNPEQPSADGKAQDIAASLDRANQKLKSESLDYFDQHSLLTCLVHLVRNKFH
ncbi:hypothetical protein PtA15_7A202 [Puccinia triticina]|uniref:Uncharacterized protein n=1 Tax=Puccinia triticina TaxID=208348 RepID=A0ABY7CMM1_9BASI|nr:uncharacterized protein PtA15_7A202 [Puccinia triticina]WAQ86476.1 hypothetical protein PtA15_7A202 [Puccinia triticina]